MTTQSKLINQTEYGQLLSAVLPCVIENEQEYRTTFEHATRLLRKTDKSFEELKLTTLLVHLIDEYETKTCSLEKASPLEILQELMDARDLRPCDLWEVIGSKSNTSEILHGKRGISKNNAKALAEFFHVSPALFL